MGGKSTAVSATTDSVFLESAFFAPAAIAGRARRLGLHTDASLRFERGVDPTGQVRGDRARHRAAARHLRRAGRSGRARRARRQTCRSGPPWRCGASGCAPFSVSTCRRRPVAAIFERLEMKVRADGGGLARDAAGVPLRRRDRGGPDRGSRPHVRLRRDSGHAGRGRRAARPRQRAGRRYGAASSTCSSARGLRRGHHLQLHRPGSGGSRQPRRSSRWSSRIRSRATWPCCGVRCGRGSSTRRGST